MNARRGYMPEDERNFTPSAIETMRTASRHIGFLINEGYDLKQAAAFVGNHFLLSERQRLAIVRSLAADEQLKNRKAKEKKTGDEVWIDGFNTIITLEVLFSGSIRRYDQGPGRIARYIQDHPRNGLGCPAAFRSPDRDGNEDGSYIAG